MKHQSAQDRKIQIELKKKASGLTSKSIKFEHPVQFKGNEEFLRKKTKQLPKQNVTNIFKFDDLDEVAKIKARSWWVDGINQVDFAQDQGIIFDDSRKLAPEEIGLNNPLEPSGYDLSNGMAGNFIQYADLKVEDSKKFNKYLGLSDKILEKVNYEIQSNGSDSTRLVFFDNSGGNSEGSGGEISLSPDISWIDEHYEYDANLEPDEKIFQKSDIPTVAEGHEVLNAFDKFADLMDDSLKHLKASYEYQFDETNIEDQIETNDYTFDIHGNRTDEDAR